MGQIAWTSIADYAMAHGFEDEETGDLFTYIQAMDSAYLKHYNTKRGK